MEITVNVKNVNAQIQKLKRAEELLKELRSLLEWDLSGGITLEIGAPSAAVTTDGGGTSLDK